MKILKKFREFYYTVEDDILGKNDFHCFLLMIDYFFCFLLHGCSITNYFVYGFYAMRNNEKAKYVTLRRQRWIYSKCNDPSSSHLLRDKDYINKNFKDFLNRDWIDVSVTSYEDFLEFLASHKEVFYKPIEGTEGKGLGIIEASCLPESKKEELYQEWKTERYLLEEKLDQHQVIKSIHPSSVNTIRITTIRTDKRTEIMSTVLRIGRFGDVNDNYTTGGIVAAIDRDTGIVKVPAIDKWHRSFHVHPETQVAIVGTKIPFWKETLAMVDQLSQVVPQIRYTGWDIAITPNGPALIEGNYQGNFHVQQHSEHRGLYYRYKEVIKDIGENYG